MCLWMHGFRLRTKIIWIAMEINSMSWVRSYSEARIGLVVPDYVPISRIEELNADKERFGAKIVGIDAGSGIMKVTNDAISAYQLDFTLAHLEWTRHDCFIETSH